MLSALAVPAAALALAGSSYQSSIEPLPKPMQARLKAGGFWRSGCPVPLSGLRLLTVTHRDFNGKNRTGQLVVNAKAAPKLRVVFRKLHGLHFPIRHMRFDDFYGPVAGRPRDGDVTASFQCRQSVSSPCSGAGPSGRWSNHAYGLAVDVNPRENPYVGCGMSRDPSSKRYLNRSRHLRGMVSSAVVRAFASIGWGWGGSWSGQTKDYMHFSSTGR